jgi:hypothetical protein
LVCGELRSTAKDRDTVGDTQLLHGPREQLAAHRSALEQNDRNLRQNLRQYEPGNPAAAAQIDKTSVNRDSPNERFGKTQSVQQVLLERSWAYGAKLLSLHKTLEQRRRQIGEGEPCRRRITLQ